MECLLICRLCSPVSTFVTLVTASVVPIRLWSTLGLASVETAGGTPESETMQLELNGTVMLALANVTSAVFEVA